MSLFIGSDHVSAQLRRVSKSRRNGSERINRLGFQLCGARRVSSDACATEEGSTQLSKTHVSSRRPAKEIGSVVFVLVCMSEPPDVVLMPTAISLFA